MNVTQLEADLRTAQTKAIALIDKTRADCGEPGSATAREMTAEERTAINAALGEMEAIEAEVPLTGRP
jgi:hypothetical protein